ncbi:tripartite tricarboxylate transporter TctB family protein [Tardiphaga sp. 538_B7_N1_4]|uniref:tripartite tricarboxylate transporter TctB family protein n=1 Tax=Tardiphaga sp. 538_B7_N1_4 TaxID=3240778 RepID=UPI001B8A3533|nr:tripartite tricarboxylate transporter TctB family protein [Bradyrhizobium diazoefficiens]MBR0967344.1 tripartite tricarboxylate transporter TctB family protein [Bradyrhizobium diazoefficiens]MBR0976665.1 tripartite tricarboxylate transporter TctB family protein [Bradyrhizobium diazoefficiens]MBR1005310.1 tripartite tricarboxylate transporter TctB family protein [Bradyrhizobium diazoefficiens]MBR1011783.1 tripartite tricarboxylate transporter TctB family protein [Bradyrhizobium diazoefficiens
MLKIRGPQDVGAGILFLAFGIAMLMGSADLAQGTPLRMGPGYAPRLLCYGLIIIGAALLLRGLKIDGESTGPWNFRAMIFVLLSILVFAFGIERLGLVLTTFLVVGISSLATKVFRPVELIAVCISMAVGSTLLFVYGLRLTIPVWPQF